MSNSTFVSFKNVGVREFETRQITSVVSQSAFPIGIKMPVTFGQGDEGLFTMNMTLADEIQDNLKNLVLTNHGERLALYDYGANLVPLAAEYTTIENFDGEAMVRINTAVSKYMPFVQLEGFRSDAVLDDNRYTGLIRIFLKYTVPRANIAARVLEVSIFAI
jgi:phage baseplate assembly protein W